MVKMINLWVKYVHMAHHHFAHPLVAKIDLHILKILKGLYKNN